MSAQEAPTIARMHTAEHLLSAVMRRRFGSPRNLELHLGEKKTKCDFLVPRPLAAEDLALVEAEVNAEIAAGHSVTAEVVSRDEAERAYDLWKVPPDAAEIRIVRIGAVDAAPCVGDHVRSTREVGRFRITTADMKDERTVRIRFTLEP